jgi:uncharacterized membrane protein
MDRKKEFKQAARETSRYLLSHHEPEDYYRCYSFSFFEKKVRLCARCTGIYPGVAAGLASVFILDVVLPVFWIALSAVPTFIEKYFTGVKDYEGYNILRSLTGFVLGAGYVNGVVLLARDPLRPLLLGIGLIYILVAAMLILKQRDKAFLLSS